MACGGHVHLSSQEQMDYVSSPRPSGLLIRSPRPHTTEPPAGDGWRHLRAQQLAAHLPRTTTAAAQRTPGVKPCKESPVGPLQLLGSWNPALVWAGEGELMQPREWQNRRRGYGGLYGPLEL